MKGELAKEDSICAYARGAAELCWMISIQDPPVHMIQVIEKGKSFNKDLFSEFTARGDVYDYLVWPALLVDKSGRLLHKGVAQPSKSKERSASVNGSRRNSPELAGQEFNGNLSQAISHKSITVSFKDTRQLLVHSVTSRSSQTDEFKPERSFQNNKSMTVKDFQANVSKRKAPDFAVGSVISVTNSTRINVPEGSRSQMEKANHRRSDSPKIDQPDAKSSNYSKSQRARSASLFEKHQREKGTCSPNFTGSCRASGNTGSGSEDVLVDGNTSTRL